MQFRATLCIVRTVASNRRVRFEYELQESIQAGILLSGQEVKACRAGQVDLSGAYVSFARGNAVLKHMTVRPYRFASAVSDDPLRDRTLLLSAAEIDRLKELSEQKGVSIIPLEVLAGRHIKVLLAVGKGRKTIDKRHRIKERDTERRLRRQGDI